MTGEKNLGALLSQIKPVLRDDTYVFVTLPDRTMPAGCVPLMTFQEAEGTTLILTEKQAASLGLPSQFPCRMITLDVHSSLEAVGFIASVAIALTEQGIGMNPVAGFFHDHLFIPEGREEDAMRAITALASAQDQGPTMP